MKPKLETKIVGSNLGRETDELPSSKDPGGGSYISCPKPHHYVDYVEHIRHGSNHGQRHGEPSAGFDADILGIDEGQEEEERVHK